MMNELGLGVVVSMKDMFTQNAHRIQASMMSLDASVAASAESMQRNMQLIQRGTMMMGAGLALLAVPTVVVTSTLRTQKALGEMASLGIKDLASLSAAAEDFSNTWGGTSKAEFIAASYDIKSGIASLTDAAVGEYTKLAALTAKATKSTVAEMTSLFATGYGIYRNMYAKMGDFEFGEMFSGGIAASVQAFKTTGSGMASAISSLGATATTAKIPLEEQLAILGMLQATMSGAEAGTKYRAFMKSAAEAGKELNLEFVDQNNNLLGMTAILKKLRERYGETLDAMEKMEIQKAFGRAEAVAVVDLFYTKIGDLTSSIRQMNVAMRQGTRLTVEMAQAMNMDIGSQLSLVGQQMHNLFEIMGETLLPVVNPLIRGVSAIIMALQRAAKAAPGLTRVVLALSAALGAALVAVGGFMAGAGMVGIMLPAIKAGIVAIGGALSALGGAIATYFWPVVAVIVGVVAAIYLLRKAWQSNFAGIRDIVMGAYDRIKTVFQGLWQLLSSLSSGTGRISAELAQKLKAMGLWGFVKTVFMVFHRAREYVVGYLTAIMAAFRKVAKILEPPIRALLSAYGALYKAIFSVVEIFGVAGTAADGSSFRSLGATIGTVLGVIAQFAAYVIKFVVYPLSWVIRLTALVVRGVVLLVKGIVQGVIYAGKFLYKFALPFRMLIQAIAAVVKIAYALWQVLTGDISVVDGLKKIGGAILHYLTTPFRWARDVAAGVWGFIKGLFTGAVSFFKWAGNAIVSAILNLPVVKTLAGIFRNVRAFFTGDKTFFQAGKGILLAIGKGILSAITLPFRLIRKAFGWIRRLLPFSDAQEGPLSTLTAAGRALITTLCKGILSVAALPLKIIGGIFRGALRIAGAVWSGIKGVVGKGWETIKGIGKAAAGVLAAPFRLGLSLAGRVWSGVKTVASAGWAAVKGAGSAAVSVLAAPFRWFGKAAAGAWSGVKSAVARGWEFVKGTGNPAVGILTAPFRLAMAINRRIWGGLKGVVTAGWNAVKSVGSTVWSAVSAPFRWIGSAASSAWSGIKSAASSAWEGMKSLAGSALSFMAAPFEKLRDVASGAWDWIKGKATGAWESIKTGVASGVQAVKSMASAAFEAGKSVLSTVAEGAKAAISAPYRAVKGALGAVRKLLPFSDAQEGPLSNLSASGQAIIQTLAGGIERVGKLPATVFSKVWGFLGGIGKAVVAPKIAPAVAAPEPVSVRANAPSIRPELDTAAVDAQTSALGGLMGRLAGWMAAPFRGIRDAAATAWSGVVGEASRAVAEMKSGTGGLSGVLAAPLNALRQSASTAWVGIKDRAAAGIEAIRAISPSAFDAGKAVLSTLAQGAKAAVAAPYEAVKTALGAVRKLLPFSDAQEGPLSQLSRSGQAIIETLTGGMQRAAKLPETVFGKVWGFLTGLGQAKVQPEIEPRVAPAGPMNVDVPSPVVRPQLDVAGLLSRLPLVGGIAGRMAKALSLPFGGDLFAGPMKALQRLVALPSVASAKMKGFAGSLAGAVAAPKVAPQILSPAPATVDVNAPTVRPQLDTGGVLSKLPLIGGLFQRLQPALSDLGGRLIDGLAGAWDRYAAFWRMMRDGALDTVAALRQVAGVALPTALAGTLALTPVLATPLPSVAMNAGPAAAMVAPVAEAAPANVIRTQQFAEAPVTIPPAVHVAPMISVAAAAEKPAPTVVKEREVERTRMLAERVTTLAPAPPTQAGPPDAQSPLAALLAKLDALGDRPIDVNVTVVSKLDGRAVAQAVYKDIRRQKVKNYETL